jgi:hypothetical protein
MTDEFDLEAFEADLDRTLDEGREAFRGIYKDELNELAGFSRTEIDAITPDTTDLEKYDELISVVKAASARNIAQAELKRQIEKLGEVAIKIAKKAPALAGLFL